MAILKPIQKNDMKSINAKIQRYLNKDISDYGRLQDLIIQTPVNFYSKKGDIPES